jgi:hypothetical protein
MFRMLHSPDPVVGIDPRIFKRTSSENPGYGPPMLDHCMWASLAMVLLKHFTCTHGVDLIINASQHDNNMVITCNAL